jgi:hypothetical protein
MRGSEGGQEKRMTTRWLFRTTGEAPYYQDRDYIYEAKTGQTEFSVSGGWWFSVKDGSAAYYETDGWIFTPNGKPAFFFG